MITPLTDKQRVMVTVTITADDGEEITAAQVFDHKPEKEELTKLITDEKNARTSRKIIEGGLNMERHTRMAVHGESAELQVGLRHGGTGGRRKPPGRVQARRAGQQP